MRINWVERELKRLYRLGMKTRGPTPGLVWKLCNLSTGGAGGIPGVAVKCVEIRRNTGREGGLLD